MNGYLAASRKVEKCNPPFVFDRELYRGFNELSQNGFQVYRPEHACLLHVLQDKNCEIVSARARARVRMCARNIVLAKHCTVDHLS
jgi:hypothetical protein